MSTTGFVSKHFSVRFAKAHTLLVRTLHKKSNIHITMYAVVHQINIKAEKIFVKNARKQKICKTERKPILDEANFTVYVVFYTSGFARKVRGKSIFVCADKGVQNNFGPYFADKTGCRDHMNVYSKALYKLLTEQKFLYKNA